MCLYKTFWNKIPNVWCSYNPIWIRCLTTSLKSRFFTNISGVYIYCGYKLILFFMVIWKSEDFIYFNKKFYFKIFKLFLSYELNKKTEKILKLSNDRNKRNKFVPKSHGWGFKHISLFWSFFKGRIFFVFLFSLYNKKSLRTNKYRNIYHETKHLNISGEQKKKLKW